MPVHYTYAEDILITAVDDMGHDPAVTEVINVSPGDARPHFHVVHSGLGDGQQDRHHLVAVCWTSSRTVCPCSRGLFPHSRETER